MKRLPHISGNTAITHYDVLIIGSGAGGSAASEVLTRNGKKVLILEAGSNYFKNLDKPGTIQNFFTKDELTINQRNFTTPDPIVEPRTFRSDAKKVRTFIGDVNHLPKTVGGGAVQADLKVPRFYATDFQLGSLLGEIQGANFADWPVDYDGLEPFYTYSENLMGVQGIAGYDPHGGGRREPYPMPPGVPMYLGLKLSDGAKRLGYHPFPYPTAVNSRPYGGRPACNDCGFCSYFGCTTSAKSSPAVTSLRTALLSGNATLMSDTRTVKLEKSGNDITGVECIGPDGRRATYKADRYILAASPIENARLLLLSDRSGSGIGNSSGWVGRNLTFHLQTIVVGIFEERMHGHRGRSVTHGMADFRGIPGKTPMGGIIEFAAPGGPLSEALIYAQDLKLKGESLKRYMEESPMRDRLAALIMQGEDAPQLTNQVDLDPEIRDLDGLPVARITYKNHSYEIDASKYYAPKMAELLRESGAQYIAVAPRDKISQSRHIMGTLRFGTNPKTSVCNPLGQFHDIGNLFAADGSLFPTSSGFNPTLTIIALGARVGAGIIDPLSPERALL